MVVGRVSVAKVRNVGVWSWWAALLAPSIASAQPQDDAALADVREEKPTPTLGAVHREHIADAPPLSLQQLRQEYSDLEVAATPQSGIGFFLGSVVPFQAFALGLNADLYALPRLRFSGFATLGISPTLNGESMISGYAEGSVGVAVLQSIRETSVNLPVPTPRLPVGPGAPVAKQRGMVPVSHSLELEIGALTGQYTLYECTDNCIDANGFPTAVEDRTMQRAGSQLAIPFAGLRYVYYRWARSKNTPFRSIQRFQIAAHVLTRPFNDPAPGLQKTTGQVIKQQDVGGRVIFQFPGFQRSPDALAFSVDMTLGWLPSPSDAILQFNFVLF